MERRQRMEEPPQQPPEPASTPPKPQELHASELQADSRGASELPLAPMAWSPKSSELDRSVPHHTIHNNINSSL